MASYDKYFFGFILVAFVLSVGGILYFHATGKAQWAEKDKQMTLGCLASFAIAIPELIIVYSAFLCTRNHIIPRLPPSTSAETKTLMQIVLFLASLGFVAWVDRFLRRNWTFWFKLHSIANRGEKAHQDRKQPEWIERLSRIFSNGK